MAGQNFAMNVHLIVVVEESERSDFKLLVIPPGIKVVFHGCILWTTEVGESKKYVEINARKLDILDNFALIHSAN